MEKTAVVFGGNGFMGSETVLTILPHFDRVLIVNRGNWYFDSNARITGRKGIHQIKCDRFKNKHENNLLKCAEFVKIANQLKQIDAVIDFSAYKPKAIHDAVEALKGKIKLYIYISSDSVYEVCEGYDKATDPAKEIDAVRPSDPKIRRFLRHQDSYGDDKLAGEEALAASNVPYVILRLPDVIGQRDTTHRWWPYQLWIQHFNIIKKGIPIPDKFLNLKTSYVYSKDVAAAALKVIQTRESKPEILNEAYNLGFNEGFTLLDLLQDIATELGVSESVKYEKGASEDAFTLFPSVTRGMLNIEKAKQLLGYEPTPWKQALKETVAFYRDGLISFPTERDQAVESLMENVISEADREKFIDFISEITASELTLSESENQRVWDHEEF